MLNTLRFKYFTYLNILFLFFFFYQYIITDTFKNIKTLSPGTNVLGVPGKNHKKKFLIKKLTKNN